MNENYADPNPDEVIIVGTFLQVEDNDMDESVRRAPASAPALRTKQKRQKKSDPGPSGETRSSRDSRNNKMRNTGDARKDWKKRTLSYSIDIFVLFYVILIVYLTTLLFYVFFSFYVFYTYFS